MAEAKRILTTITLLAACLVMMAGPASRGLYRTLQLANGRQMRAMLVGDEYGSFWRGDDGKAYQLVAGSYQTVDEKAIIDQAQTRRAQANTLRAKQLPHTRGIGDYSGYFGHHKSLVILVNFADVTFQEGHDNALFQRIFNEEHFNEPPFVGSVADYFRDQSRGQFTLDFDVLGPVTLSREFAYYGENKDNCEDAHAADMVIEAVNQVKDQVTDWHQYDWDDDGEVEQVFLVYAGYSEESGGNENAIWPRQGFLSYYENHGYGSGPISVADGLEIDCFACSEEIKRNNTFCGIGTICHEYGHCLGLPDIYDTSYSGGWGMYYWDIMSYGLELGNYYHPAGYTSLERWMLGWSVPIVLEDTDTAIVNMKSLQQGGESYIIYNKGHRDEFFLLENRQLDGWDASLYGAGLLITHIDYDSTIWNSRRVNSDYRHQRVSWVPADGKKQIFLSERQRMSSNGLENDPFPHYGVSAFNRSYIAHDAQSRRAARWFYPNVDGSYFIDSSVEDITQNADGTISFRFVAAYSGAEPDDTPKTVNLEDLSGYCVAQDGTTLTGTLPPLTVIMIDEDATVTLSGTTILGKDIIGCDNAGLTCLGNATIILDSCTQNVVRGFYNICPGIYVSSGKTLTIKGHGQLTARSNGNGAGIGGGYRLGCGNILIEGGIINAEGGNGAAAIGGGYGASCGNITITDGVTSVTATAGEGANSIGAGYGDAEHPSSCGTVTIGGVETGSISQSPYTYIPGSSGINSVATGSRNDGKWHTLDGRQLKSPPKSKGVYIHNGKKVIR